MTDDFKRKLQDYKNGKLSDEERAELEQQLEKMEIYQSYLDEMLDGEEEHRNPGANRVTDKELNMYKREASLLRKGKWRARIGTVFTLISLYIIVTVLTSIGTALYYWTGDPNRYDIYRDVVESAIAVTYPNVTVHISGEQEPI
ncbi:sigma factor regulator N-terminal domain-containing protein [Paenibacillus sp. D2_2]|uniref:sigma factor regulator N-terminal domain-containing protein n=1 Tax=Paenibacillus sp. D2_2 TaxID=3073092 RepID=UPI002814FC80|nr:sigma factor regulator N-terminal domain-containing protein [Paenibacillus sp. D2_2]WMT43252.1 sigma factor regulator N-terminal domain-containing protein [Paenibacillus sp. D2_2]